ncbi:MAG: cytochrome c oxidase subunit 1, partial [Paraglaciecola sp.]
MTTTTDDAHAADHHDGDHHEHHIPYGLKRWLYTTNHK